MQQGATEIQVLEHQKRFITSGATHTGLVAGFGAGKSKAGTIKTVAKKMGHPGVNVAYYLPTYPLIKDIAVPDFKNFLAQIGCPYGYHKTDKEFTTPFGKIILRSMDKPETIVGYEVGYSLVDEADTLPKKKMRDVFVKIVARNRAPLHDGSPNCIDLVSTPEGFEFMYEFFVKEKKANRRLVKGRTKDNPFLPEGYIGTLKEIYTPEELQAYLDGEFTNLASGSVYHKFNRERNHSDRGINKGEVLHVGMDFNITKMSAVVHVVESGRATAVAEITGAYDTADMAIALKERYAGHRVVVYPDASGNNRNTAGVSDIQLLKKAGFTVRASTRNPSVRDRVTTLNASFLNANGETAYYVNTHNCPQYAEALEKLAYKNGAPDKDSGFDHITDAGGYCLYQLKKPKTSRIYV